MPQLKDINMYAIVDSQTDEVWNSTLFHNIVGAKSSFKHASKRYDRD